MKKIGDVIKDKTSVVRDKYVSREFQKYGWDLANELNDLSHKALYIKLAKTTPRHILEAARTFVSDATNANSKARLFMWKVKNLKDKISQPDKGIVKTK